MVVAVEEREEEMKWIERMVRWIHVFSYGFGSLQLESVVLHCHGISV